MKTPSLGEAIDQARSDLKYIADAVASTRSTGTLGRESYKFFGDSLQMSAELQHAKDLLAVRAIALDAVQKLSTRKSAKDPTKYDFHGLYVSWKVGRFLTVQNYLATTWALYDSVSKVAGTLCCTDEKVRHPTKPAKLPEDFLKGKDAVGARMREHIKGAYAWPIGLSYALRNWFVHAGHAHNAVDLFKFNDPEPAPFELSDDAWQLILTKCNDEYNAQKTQTRLTVFPELAPNLIDGLIACHGEVDEVMSFVILWATGSIRLQVKLLFSRDT